MGQPSQSSGLKAADAVISALPCRVTSVQLIGDGTNACNVILYDNATGATGTEVCKISVKAGNTYEMFFSDDGIQCNAGCYADVTGTGAGYIVHFRYGN